jgi:hypothetical protein
MVSSFRGLAVPLMVGQHRSPKLDLQIDSIVDIMVEGIGRPPKALRPEAKSSAPLDTEDIGTAQPNTESKVW